MRIACAALLLALLPASRLLAQGTAPHLVQAVCQNCHGIDGVAVVPGAANLSGQQREYLIQQLRVYRSGTRQDPQMNVVAKSLSDRDIEELALWYSSIKVTVEKPK
jgi:cytochrome c553